MSESGRAPFLLAMTLGSAGAFVLLARAVARRRTAPIDHDVHQRVAVDEGHPIRDAAESAAPIGKWWTYVPVAAIAGGFVLAKQREVSGAATIVAAAVAAALINKRFDDLLDQPPAPPGRDTPDHPVFPSGHAFGTSAVALTAAYVLSREELVPAVVAYPLALALPAASSAARLMEEKHWISDIVGGVLAATSLASLALAVYELSSSRARRPLTRR